MTKEEAIEVLKIEYLGDSDEMVVAKKLAVEALEKQIPKNPLNPDNYYTKNRCPSCNSRIKSGCGSSATYRNNWCNHCGQKINWSSK